MDTYLVVSPSRHSSSSRRRPRYRLSPKKSHHSTLSIDKKISSLATATKKSIQGIAESISDQNQKLREEFTGLLRNDYAPVLGQASQTTLD